MATESQFCLKWSNYGSTLTSSLNNLYQQKEFVDVTLVAEDVQMKAHKVVLSACSPYFQNILKSNPCQHPVIILKEVTSEDLQSVISFIYEGEVNVTQQRLHTFMKLAEILQVRGLTESNNSNSSLKVNSQKPQETNNEKSSSTLDLSTNKKSFANEKQKQYVNASNLNSGTTASPYRSLENNEPAKSSPTGPSASESSRESHRKRRRSSSAELVTSLTPESTLERDSPSSLPDLLEIKMENSDDSDEGKENGKSDESNVEPSYSLRKVKSRTLKTTPQPIPVLGNSEKKSSVGGAEESISISSPILTVPQRSSLASTHLSKNNEKVSRQPEFPTDPYCQSLPYPCPFCEKSYTSWGFRRRHIKGYHTGTPELACKWCFALLPTHIDWENHVTQRHKLSLNDARNGILILEEAHMVLQIAQPLRIDSLMEIVKHKKAEENKSSKEDKLNEAPK